MGTHPYSSDPICVAAVESLPAAFTCRAARLLLSRIADRMMKTTTAMERTPSATKPAMMGPAPDMAHALTA